MIPDIAKVTIDDNVNRIYEFLDELIVRPKSLLTKWAKITKQTPAAKIGYIGQHLASLITGVCGTSTGARGDDLADGSEVKSCNKIDQADKCHDCGARVMRVENVCPSCGSANIDRKDDSKWLFSVRDVHELNQYLNMDRVLLILMDYPEFKDNVFKDIRISAYEIYPKEERMQAFGQLLQDYFYKNYSVKRDAGKKPAPMNLHPFGFQFYKCNPILTFRCLIKDIDDNPSIEIDVDHYVDPCAVRDENLASIEMPSSLLKANKGEWNALIDRADFDNEIRPHLAEDMDKDTFRALTDKEKVRVLPCLDEKMRSYIPLRDIVLVEQANHYQRH